MTQILVFGTSTTYGCWDVEGGWVQRLRKYLDEKQLADPEQYYIVYNLGISGDTSTGILNRIEFESEQRLGLKDKGEEVIVIVSVGANDSILNKKTKKNHVYILEYEKNIQKIVDKAKKIGSKVVFVGNKKMNESLVDPIPWLPGYAYKNKFVKMYEEKTKEVCKKNKVGFIDIFTELSENYEKMLTDGVHPNSEGHEKIFEVVKNYLFSNRII